MNIFEDLSRLNYGNEIVDKCIKESIEREKKKELKQIVLSTESKVLKNETSKV